MTTLRCPSCGRRMNAVDLCAPSQPVVCLCGGAMAVREGIWRALAPRREPLLRRFMDEYIQIRLQEGRGALSDDYYLALPYRDVSGNNAWQWKIRGRTFAYFEARVLPQIERRAPLLDVLDVGAGNGWLSYRLALRGHRCIAVDLLDNAFDGLGAGSHYLAHLDRPFARVQAEMNRLPFDDRQFDLAIFNASLHYSENYSRTVAEALRCLRPGGDLVILDSPFYRHDESGRAMLRERRAEFLRRYGFASDALASREYLTRPVLQQLEGEFHLRWRTLRPWYGWAWAMRPWRARLRRKREPSKFYIFWGRTQP